MAASEPQQFGEFAVIEKLGQGAMGAVYKARQTSLNRVVALKLLPAHYAADPDFLTRFKNEAMAAAALNHPHIVQVYAAGEDKGTHFFAMEYVEGESFGARMERKGRIEPREAIAVACHVAQALEYAWRKAKVIHRDIKPDNIFLSREGTVKVGDLGLAKLLGDPRGGVTQTGAAMGTPYYVSPEQAMAVREIDFRSDIYSLGCTIYHALTGEPPYRGKSAMAVMMQHISQAPPNIQTVWPACPPPLIGLLDRMLRKRPEERHESYAALLEELFQVAGRLDKPSPPEEVAHSLVVPKAVPRPPSTPDANRKSAPSAKDTTEKTVPPARKRAKIPAILLAVAAAGIIGLFIWHPWKKPVRAPGGGLAVTATATKDSPFVNSLGMKFVPVPGTQVLFCIHETRKDDYAAYAAENARAYGPWRNPSRDGVTVSFAGDHPVCSVSWTDAEAFCAWLGKKEGRTYRLPTDHEWSVAVGVGDRETAGLTPESLNDKILGEYPWGKEWPPPKGAGNFCDTATKEKFPSRGGVPGYTDGFATTAPVMSFTPNKLGIFDLAGNVWGYCEDWFDAAQTMHPIRGGNWDDGGGSGGNLLSSHRGGVLPGTRHESYGFRCVVEIPAHATAVPTASIIPSSAPKDAPPETSPAKPAVSKPAPPTITATKGEPFMNSLDMKFVPVPGTQTLFCIWETRVRDYEAYAKANVVEDAWRKQEKDGRPVSRESDYPVVGVTWDEARAFCKWLTAKESAEGTLPKGMQYRLPTDEEWSRAAGLAKEEGATPQDRNWKNELDFPWGTDFPPKAKVGNFADETFHKTFSQVPEKWVEGYDDNYATTSPVGVFARNEFGLHDMEGNVREWCEDAFDSGQSERVLRGASWSVGSRPYMLSSYRLHISPVSRGPDLGFRCVLETGVTVPSVPTAAAQPSPPAPAPTPAPTAEKSDTVPDADGYLWLLGGNPYGAWKQCGNGGFILQDGVATSWLPKNGEGCWWHSKRKFGDFTLKLEFRIQTPGGNSGVYVRLPDPGDDMNVVRGQSYQIDISDSKNPMEMTGAICFVKAPTSVPQKAGEWNEMEIYAFGQRYMVKLNGALVNDFTGTRGLSGYIGLQDYSVGGVQFRNVRIKTLSSPAELPKPTSETEKWLEQVAAIYQPLYKRDATAPFQSGMAELKKSYLTALTRESTGARATANVKDAIACRNERQRIEEGGSIPADDSDQPPAVLKTLRAAYRTQAARLEVDRRKHATTVFTQYDKVLATNQAALTQRQRLDEALLLQQRRDALATEWGVTPPAGSAAAATISQPFVNTLGMKFVPVPILGGPTGGRRVLFSIWDTRVQDYAVYAGESAGVKMDWKDAQYEGVKQGPTHPVVNVSWVDAKAFCAWLTRKERAAGKLSPTDEYPLPGDYEWSCAVGIGDREDPRTLPSVKDGQIRGVYPWGTTWPPPKDAANVLSANGYKFTSPVGSFAVNKNGLYDMGGNVWQWCEDWYDVKQQGRVLRGGAWNTFAPPVNLLASYRTLLTPGYRGGTYGFRCVLDIGAPTK